MAIDYFMKMEGIKGESTASGHQGEIDVLTFSWGGEAVAGARFQAHDFQFTHRIDSASPLLIKACATGQHIPTATLTVRRLGSGGSKADYLKYTFTDVLVSSFQEGGHGEALPTEECGINFSALKVAFSPQKNDGSLGAPITVILDLLRAG